jgi:hypothetical protein
MTIGGTGLDYAVDMMHAVCRLAGSPSFENDLQTELQQHGIVEAIDCHDTPMLFDWLATLPGHLGPNCPRVHGATWPAHVERYRREPHKSPTLPQA